MSGSLRAFFALEPDTQARRLAARVRETLATRRDGDGVKWVRDEALHVTLRFLGRVESDDVGKLIERVGDRLRGASEFELALGDLQGFPTERRPRVVVLGLEPEEPAVRLARRVEGGVVDAGFDPEERPFRAHLTLGRVRRGRRAPRLDGVPRPEFHPFTVREVVLFQSLLERDGAHYIPLERLPLAADTVTP